MTMCTIRIELHDASWQDYINLATYLSQKGITDVIRAYDGSRYKMSGGHYNYLGQKTFDQVYEDAVWCATMVGKRYGLMVSDVSANKWTGLPAVY